MSVKPKIHWDMGCEYHYIKNNFEDELKFCIIADLHRPTPDKLPNFLKRWLNFFYLTVL